LGGGTDFGEELLGGVLGLWGGVFLEVVVVFYGGEEGEEVFFELGADVIFTAYKTHGSRTTFVGYTTAHTYQHLFLQRQNTRYWERGVEVYIHPKIQ